jgi:hypothetical protein
VIIRGIRGKIILDNVSANNQNRSLFSQKINTPFIDDLDPAATIS